MRTNLFLNSIPLLIVHIIIGVWVKLLFSNTSDGPITIRLNMHFIFKGTCFYFRKNNLQQTTYQCVFKW